MRATRSSIIIFLKKEKRAGGRAARYLFIFRAESFLFIGKVPQRIISRKECFEKNARNTVAIPDARRRIISVVFHKDFVAAVQSDDSRAMMIPRINFAKIAVREACFSIADGNLIVSDNAASKAIEVNGFAETRHLRSGDRGAGREADSDDDFKYQCAHT